MKVKTKQKNVVNEKSRQNNARKLKLKKQHGDVKRKRKLKTLAGATTNFEVTDVCEDPTFHSIGSEPPETLKYESSEENEEVEKCVQKISDDLQINSDDEVTEDSFEPTQDLCDLTQDTCDLTQDTCDLTQDTCDLTQDTCDLTQDTCDLTQDTCDLTQDTCDLTQDTCNLTQDTCELTNDSYEVTQNDEQPSVPNKTEDNTKATSMDQIVYTQMSDKEFLVSMKANTILHFLGKLVIEVVAGCVEVLGWRMRPGDKHSVFSPRGSSLLGVRAVEASSFKVRSHECHTTSCLAALCNVSLLSNRRADDVQLPSPRSKQQAERVLDCKFTSEFTREPRHLTRFNADWDHLLSDLVQIAHSNKNSRIVLCGGKGVGKSTLLRVLTNKLLLSANNDDGPRKGVLVLDYDPGQSEFTPPGMLAVTYVNTPLLGPGYMHQKTPERMIFLGHVDMSQCSHEYQWAVHDLIKYCKAKYPAVPWLVNTMGFNTGLGVFLMETILKALEPQPYIVDIQSQQRSRNYPRELWLKRDQTRYYPIYSAAELSDADEKKQAHWGLPARELREIALISYLSPALQGPERSLISSSPFVIKVKSLVLGVLHEKVHPSHILRSLVGNLVGLCHANDTIKAQCVMPAGRTGPLVITRPVALPCCGYGVVVGVDPGSGLLYLTTPEARARLSPVNCLLLGAVQLPKQVRIVGVTASPCPYTAAGFGQVTSAPSKRYYRPFNTTPKR